MTLREIASSDKPFLTPSDVAPILGCAPHSINLQARKDASLLGFPVCVIGTRVRIPRLAFLAWMGRTPDGTETHA